MHANKEVPIEKKITYYSAVFSNFKKHWWRKSGYFCTSKDMDNIKTHSKIHNLDNFSNSLAIGNEHIIVDSSNIFLSAK